MRLFSIILFILSALVVSLNSKSIELDEENWQCMLNGEWMIQFVAPWCTSCKNMAPIWEHFSKIAEKHSVQVGKVDVIKSPTLSGRFLVTSLPTICHVIDGKFRYYYGKRDNEALIHFIKHKQWKNIEPVSSWTDPKSLHMRALSYFFRLSFLLKEWDACLQDEYGFTPYGSYGIFVTATILICGMLFGMLDVIWPTKKHSKHCQFKEIKKSDEIDNLKKGNDMLSKTNNLSNDELAKEEEQIIEFKSDNDDDDSETEIEKNDEGIDDGIIDENDNDDEDDGDDDDVINSAFVMSKNIELVPDMYEDDSDEDIYHNCKLILPVPSDGPEVFRKRANVTI